MEAICAGGVNVLGWDTRLRTPVCIVLKLLEHTGHRRGLKALASGVIVLTLKHGGHMRGFIRWV